MSDNLYSKLHLLFSKRDELKVFLREEYENTIQPFKSVIEQVMNANNEDVHQAVQRIRTKSNLIDTDEKLVVFNSAYVEMIEAAYEYEFDEAIPRQNESLVFSSATGKTSMIQKIFGKRKKWN
jgi:hypothetical protein